jgi:hypothetical protein
LDAIAAEPSSLAARFAAIVVLDVSINSAFGRCAFSHKRHCEKT